MRTATTYNTESGVVITRRSKKVSSKTALDRILDQINNHRGAIFASGYEYPERYARWDIGFVNPPIEIVAHGREFYIRALNKRGNVLLSIIASILENHPHIIGKMVRTGDKLIGQVAPMANTFPEEERLHQPTIFSVLRTIVKKLGINGKTDGEKEPNLGLYGAFGYDLVFQIEPLTNERHERPKDRPDLHLFLPDALVVTDHRKEVAHYYEYDFTLGGDTTMFLPRTGEAIPFRPGVATPKTSDHQSGEYEAKVKRVIDGARKGDFFEVVLSQVLSAGFTGTPRELFEKIRGTNPSPYEFLINFGTEQLVGASPEMMVQVEGRRVETCPISGTVKRGTTPLEDAENIRALLNSEKDRSELTMCTDVDRNDKARVCKPGSVKVLKRRLIEMYSRLIHTVDHVEGELREGFDAFDAFLAHMWAGTLTGAPKPAAMQMIEDCENSPRRWYGGAVGMLLFNGDIKTGITIRTVHLENGMANIRVGATLLAHSDPKEEELETQTKASAFMDAVLGLQKKAPAIAESELLTGVGKRVMFVDNRDSFVHTLADYVRQTGAEVTTHRAGEEGIAFSLFDEIKPDMVFISPGPGYPSDFKVPELVLECVRRNIPVFGVCLGLQGMVQAFGGKLGVLTNPVHGMSSEICATPTGILSELLPKERFEVGRYHSLHALEAKLPECLEILARTADGTIMAIQHKKHRAATVQFHPESIMTMGDNNVGLRLIAQVIKTMTRK